MVALIDSLKIHLIHISIHIAVTLIEDMISPRSVLMFCMSVAFVLEKYLTLASFAVRYCCGRALALFVNNLEVCIKTPTLLRSELSRLCPPSAWCSTTDFLYIDDLPTRKPGMVLLLCTT